VSASRRFHLYLPTDLESRLRTSASRRGVALAVVIRQLTAQALEIEERRADSRPLESPVMLAALVAAEHAVLMVASVLPDGEHRMQELGPQAAAAAEERLDMFREAAR
jgi:hypothetical protein